jgi:hypothetical protein
MSSLANLMRVQGSFFQMAGLMMDCHPADRAPPTSAELFSSAQSFENLIQAPPNQSELRFRKSLLGLSFFSVCSNLPLHMIALQIHSENILNPNGKIQRNLEGSAS